MKKYFKSLKGTDDTFVCNLDELSEKLQQIRGNGGIISNKNIEEKINGNKNIITKILELFK